MVACSSARLAVSLASYPPMHLKRKRSSCSCDGNYARSLQGICKAIALLLAFLTIIIIGASPYVRPIFVLEGITWPFHMVMLFVVLLFLVTLGLYVLFLTGQHLEHPQIAWPTVELVFNVVAFLVTLFAAILEVTNVWRWDYSRGFYQNNGATSLSNFGYGAGMPLTSQLNMNSYCRRNPRDCQDYFALFSGNNSYHGNHIFASVLLFLMLLCYLVASIFAFRTWRVFKREMTNGKMKTTPSHWDRLRFRFSEMKASTPGVGNVRERVGKLFNRNKDEEEFEKDVEMDLVEEGKVYNGSDVFVDLQEKRPRHASSMKSSEHKSSRSHHGGRSGNRTHSSHNDDRNSRHDEVRSEKSHHGSRSARSDRSSRSSNHRSHARSSNDGHRGKDKNLDAKVVGSIPTEEGPVASVMC